MDAFIALTAVFVILLIAEIPRFLSETEDSDPKPRGEYSDPKPRGEYSDPKPRGEYSDPKVRGDS